MKAVKFWFNASTCSRGNSHGWKRGRAYRDLAPITEQQAIADIIRIFKFNEDEHRKLLLKREAWIICTPESFIEWQFHRNKTGVINRFKELKAHWVDKEFPPKVLTLVERL